MTSDIHARKTLLECSNKPRERESWEGDWEVAAKVKRALDKVINAHQTHSKESWLTNP